MDNKEHYVIEASYQEKGYGYAFLIEEPVKVGDKVLDGYQTLTVTKIGTDYTGPMRTCRKMMPRIGGH